MGSGCLSERACKALAAVYLVLESTAPYGPICKSHVYEIYHSIIKKPPFYNRISSI